MQNIDITVLTSGPLAHGAACSVCSVWVAGDSLDGVHGKVGGGGGLSLVEYEAVFERLTK